MMRVVSKILWWIIYNVFGVEPSWGKPVEFPLSKLMAPMPYYIGGSVDDKPVNPIYGSCFYETDTRKFYYYDGEQWVEKRKKS